VILYCDTSSLVKLYVAESGSDDVRALVNSAAVVATSVIAYAETRAALARLRREKQLPPAAFARARRQFDADWASIASVSLNEGQTRRAGDLADRYGLRALDGIHLAAFVSLLERAGDDDVYFSAFDDRLVKAARKLS
jgi:predicted nucleic acid-binding protein